MLIRSILSTAAIGVAVVALAPTGADAATTTTRTIGGVRVDTTTYETGEGGPGVHLDLTLTTGRSLSVSCSRTGKVSVNGVWLSTACSEVRFGVAVVGSAGNDTVHIEGKDLGTSEDGGIRLNLGYGHDTAKVSHANGSAYLYGEGGNDRLYAGLRADRHHLPEWSKTVIDGGPGNDTLSNLGYLGDPEHTHDGQEAEEGATLIGGPGADRIWGSTTRWDHIQMDTSDSVSFSGGPGTVELATSSAADTVVVNANGNYGPKLNITSGTTTTSYALPRLTSLLTVRTGAGDDEVTVEHKSARTRIHVDGGSGTDALAVRPRSPFDWDEPNATVTQPGFQRITYDAFESVSVQPL